MILPILQPDENFTNEANGTASVHSVCVDGALELSENPTTEAAAGCENFTNEPKDHSLLIVVSPFADEGFADTRLPAAETNEANFGPLSVDSSPLSAATAGPSQGAMTDVISPSSSVCADDASTRTAKPRV